MSLKHYEYFNLLRVIASFAVVLLHVSAYYLTTPVNSNTWLVSNIYDAITRFCVPIFFMISGTIFLNPEKSITTGMIWKKYIPRLVKVFLVWSFLYAIFTILTTQGNIKIFIKTIINGHYHLWYLYALIGLYILTPLLRVIAQKKEALNYFLFLAFIFSFLIPTLQHLTILRITTHATDLLSLSFLGGYTTYFLLGYKIQITKISNKTALYIYSLGIISTFWKIFATWFYMSKGIHTDFYFYGYLRPSTLFQALAIFIFIKLHFTTMKSKVITNLSNYTFGIYLVHVLILELLIFTPFVKLNVSPIVLIPLVCIATYILSLIVSIILYKLPITKNIFF